TTLSASSTSPAYGASVIFTATVSGADSSNPAGTVEFLNGATAIMRGREKNRRVRSGVGLRSGGLLISAPQSCEQNRRAGYGCENSA
ncbi:MAG: Ig-like domain-containing protein, partial [Acidimicrobiales bacterium]